MRGLTLTLVLLAGCYTGARTSRDINAAWRGHGRGEIEARWGKPAAVQGDALVWTITHHHVELPSGQAQLHVGPGQFDLYAEVQKGASWDTTTQAVATVDRAGTILAVDGPSLRWGPPRGENLRWGVVFGFHAGMGRLDDTGTMLPGGGLYIGGMLGPRLALVGVYQLGFGKGDGGGAYGMAWGMAAIYWPLARLNVHGGPAAVLSADPGFADDSFAPGVVTGVSYAAVRSGSFVLDLRLDATGAPGVVFGTLGVGVNVN